MWILVLYSPIPGTQSAYAPGQRPGRDFIWHRDFQLAGMVRRKLKLQIKAVPNGATDSGRMGPGYVFLFSWMLNSPF